MSLSATDIEREFDATAARYDLMVSLNPGYHEHLRAAAGMLVDSLARDRSLALLDLGCGSGASTEALLGRLDGRADTDVLGIDASAGMIAQARAKQWPPGVRFAHGRAEELADPPAQWMLPDRLDGILACYLFRNVAEQERDTVLDGAYRALVPGGCLVVQEYSVAGSRRAAVLWSVVCWLVVIPLSLVLTGRTRLYRYLWRSVLRFDPVGRFTARLVTAGFAPTSVTSVPGWQDGILHTFVAHKPA